MPTTKKAGPKKAAATTGGTTLTVTAPRNANFLRVVKELERAFHKTGCPGCRSGKDRILFQDKVVATVK